MATNESPEKSPGKKVMGSEEDTLRLWRRKSRDMLKRTEDFQDYFNRCFEAIVNTPKEVQEGETQQKPRPPIRRRKFKRKMTRERRLNRRPIEGHEFCTTKSLWSVRMRAHYSHPDFALR